MPAMVLDGKRAATCVLSHVSERVLVLKKRGVCPGLATVLVGDDPASRVYVSQKIKKCEAAGMVSYHVPLPSTISQEDLESEVRRLNQDPRVHGIIVQLPLPKPLNPAPVLLSLDPCKDADGLHPHNQGRWMAMKSWQEILSSKIPLPCTPAGVMDILRQNNLSVSGRHAVILGRSSLVGKPLAFMLLAADATVTMAHSQTKNLDDVCRSADVLVAAIGRPRFVLGDWVKSGAVVVDVGINRTPQGLVGDVDAPGVSERAGALTPVPGGVGPMTVAMLLQNTVQSAEKFTTNSRTTEAL